MNMEAIDWAPGDDAGSSANRPLNNSNAGTGPDAVTWGRSVKTLAGDQEGRWMTFRVQKRPVGQSMKSLGSRWRTDGDEWQRWPYQAGAATQVTANSFLRR